MKITIKLFIAFIAMALLMTSCCEKDETNILGTWTLISSSSTNCTESYDNSTDTFSPTTCTNSSPNGCQSITLTFNDSSITLFGTSVDDNELILDSNVGTYTQNGDDYNICLDSECNTYKASFSGDQVTLESEPDSGNGCVYNIVMIK